MSIVLLQKDLTEEAFRLARQVAEREPKNATVLFVAGIAAGRLRKPDEALTLIRRAVAIEPGNAQFQVALRHLERTVVKPWAGASRAPACTSVRRSPRGASGPS
jgi:hypothetical protein